MTDYLTKFGTMMHMDPPDTDSQYNFVNSTIQDGGGRHLEKSKNHNIFATDSPISTTLGMRRPSLLTT